MNNVSKYGRFIEDGSVFEITTPNTPAQWKNYLFNKEYVTYVSQVGQGDSILINPVPTWKDRPGRHFYLRDNDTGEYFSTLYNPLQEDFDYFSCRHGLGYTEITTRKGDYEVYHRIFVPMEGEREIWTIRVKNISSKKANLSFFSYFPMHGNADFGIYTSYDKETGIIISSKIPYFSTMNQYEGVMKQKNAIVVFPDKTPDNYDCSDYGFLGAHAIPFKPEAVVNGQLNNTIASNQPSCAAYQYNILLEGNEKFELNMVMTVSDLLSNDLGTIKKYYNAMTQDSYFSKEYDKVEEFWKNASEVSHVETPDEDFNHALNYWIRKQLFFNAYTHRVSTGPCIRNDVQDMQGLCLFDVKFAIESLDRVFSFQQEDGYLQRNLVLNDTVVLGGICVLNYKDAALWLPLAVSTLVKQTGDLNYLDREIKFKNTDKTAPISEHIRRGFEYSLNDLGDHGIPLISEGDWDDPLNGPGRFDKGESTWLGMALIYSAKEYLPVAEAINDKNTIELLNKLITILDKNLNDTCWDGKWYIRGFDDFGIPFGSSKDEEGQLFLNALSWSVLSGCAKDDRLNSVLTTIDEVLNTECGPVTVYPAFTKLVERIGKLSVKKAGTQENGSIYCHAATFKAMSDCVAGRGGKAYETLKKILPTNSLNPVERSLQAPLFIPNYYIGKADKVAFGRSSTHEQTGSASWFMRIGLEHIIGVRADITGLTIDPCFPSHWDNIKLKRLIKGVVCNVSIDNSAHVEKGVKSIMVNGAEIDGQTVNLMGGVKEVNIEVIMG